jgi:hypothetical protein
MIDFFVNVVFELFLGAIGRSFLFLISLGKIKIKWHDTLDPLCSLLGMIVLFAGVFGALKIFAIF